jgi:purine-binding chemotaxis protein CheW
MADNDKQIQLVTFQLGVEQYGVDIMDVREIQRIPQTRSIPNAPAYVEGIFKLRSDIIPVINLHKRFHLAKAELGDEDKLLSGIVVLDIDGMQIGIIIDKVSRVVTLDVEQIQPPPKMLSGIGAEYIQGIFHQKEGYLIILDIRKLFSPRELRQLERIQG